MRALNRESKPFSDPNAKVKGLKNGFDSLEEKTTGVYNMNNQSEFPKASVPISKSGKMVVVSDQFGNRIPVNIDLLKHAIEMPFVKAGGSLKT